MCVCVFKGRREEGKKSIFTKSQYRPDRRLGIFTLIISFKPHNNHTRWVLDHYTADATDTHRGNLPKVAQLVNVEPWFKFRSV